MTNPRFLTAPSTLLLALTGAFLQPAAEAPRFAVEQGTVLRKAYVLTWDMDLEELSITFDGESISPGGDVSIEQDDRQRIEFVDTYRSVKDGRALELVRRFETLEAESTTDTTSPEGNDLTEQEKSSELEGREVLFRWDADAEEYAAEFVEEGGDAELLEDLEQDADLAGLLPTGDVEVGATWKVGVAEVRKLLSPGGDLAFVDEDGEDEDDGGLAEQFEENLTGELTATWKGTSDVDGREVAVVELEGEFDTSAELEDAGEGASGAATMTLTLEGELAWDVARGHARSIRLSGPCTVEFTSTMGDGAHDFEQSLTFEGTFALEGEITNEG